MKTEKTRLCKHVYLNVVSVFLNVLYFPLVYMFIIEVVLLPCSKYSEICAFFFNLDRKLKFQIV